MKRHGSYLPAASSATTGFLVPHGLWLALVLVSLASTNGAEPFAVVGGVRIHVADDNPDTFACGRIGIRLVTPAIGPLAFREGM